MPRRWQLPSLALLLVLPPQVPLPRLLPAPQTQAQLAVPPTRLWMALLLELLMALRLRTLARTRSALGHSTSAVTAIPPSGREHAAAPNRTATSNSWRIRTSSPGASLRKRSISATGGIPASSRGATPASAFRVEQNTHLSTRNARGPQGPSSVRIINMGGLTLGVVTRGASHKGEY